MIEIQILFDVHILDKSLQFLIVTELIGERKGISLPEAFDTYELQQAHKANTDNSTTAGERLTLGSLSGKNHDQPTAKLKSSVSQGLQGIHQLVLYQVSAH